MKKLCQSTTIFKNFIFPLESQYVGQGAYTYLITVCITRQVFFSCTSILRITRATLPGPWKKKEESQKYFQISSLRQERLSVLQRVPYAAVLLISCEKMGRSNSKKRSSNCTDPDELTMNTSIARPIASINASNTITPPISHDISNRYSSILANPLQASVPIFTSSAPTSNIVGLQAIVFNGCTPFQTRGLEYQIPNSDLYHHLSVTPPQKKMKMDVRDTVNSQRNYEKYKYDSSSSRGQSPTEIYRWQTSTDSKFCSDNHKFNDSLHTSGSSSKENRYASRSRSPHTSCYNSESGAFSPAKFYIRNRSSQTVLRASRPQSRTSSTTIGKLTQPMPGENFQHTAVAATTTVSLVTSPSSQSSHDFVAADHATHQSAASTSSTPIPENSNSLLNLPMPPMLTTNEDLRGDEKFISNPEDFNNLGGGVGVGCNTSTCGSSKNNKTSGVTNANNSVILNTQDSHNRRLSLSSPPCTSRNALKKRVAEEAVLVSDTESECNERKRFLRNYRIDPNNNMDTFLRSFDTNKCEAVKKCQHKINKKQRPRRKAKKHHLLFKFGLCLVGSNKYHCSSSSDSD